MHNIIRFDFRGQHDLFGSRTLIDKNSVQGIDNNTYQIKMMLQTIAGLTLTNFKCYVIHHCPSTLLIYPMGEGVKKFV